MLVCPKCGRYEYVRKSGKNSERAMCEDCELFFDVQSAEGSKPRNLKLFLSYSHAADGEYDICADIAAFLRARGHERINWLAD